jgi:ATP-grasp domain
MLAELRGSALLRGARGSRPADLDALAEVICLLGHAAVRLDGSLRALEVNPLWVNGNQVEALDVLVVTAGRPGRPAPGRPKPPAPGRPKPPAPGRPGPPAPGRPGPPAPGRSESGP